MNFFELLPTMLFAALALIMFGLGLSLSVEDFRRAGREKLAIACALALSLVVMPSVAYGISLSFGLSPTYAIGLMLLAATPGGVSANLFSYLFKGSIAVNITLTAITTLLSIVTLPLITNAAIGVFDASGQVVPLQWRKVMEVVAIVIGPVVLGMLVGGPRPQLAVRAEVPFKIFGAVMLAVFSILAIAKEWSAFTTFFATLGPAVLLFNFAALALAFLASNALRLPKPIATAISFESGIHSAALAIFVAVNVLGNLQLALPSAVYSATMYPMAALFGWALTWLGKVPASPLPARDVARLRSPAGHKR